MADRVNICQCKAFTPLEEFRSIEHFEDFERQIDQFVNQNLLKEIPVKKPMSIVEFQERWLRCSCGKVWRLVTPDFPFKGVFELVWENQEEPGPS